ncbi:hypothetical protein TELCIR_19936 [Teladorsagia circumcincta]|uniref:C-type lectin domain-containing protein n=1 Tax=Teladorsagia circumcincta TaxID=45464 RepID=A0A2G9TKV0_TELCI|nr:hypothetical protein TELCIR_19936 [Teladorsagia circumcincta]
MWTWTDGTPVNYLKWSKHQPDNAGKGEHCTQIFSDSGPGMYAVIEKHWNDMCCRARMARFVCKRRQRSVLRRRNPGELAAGIHIYYY